MKKTKLLTSIAALALVVCLGACETGDIIVNVGDVDIGGDSSDTTDTEPSEPSEPSSSDTGSTPSESEEDTSSSSSTPEEPPVVTHEYSIEVENADALKELTYDGNVTTQQGVQLSIYLVDTPSEGEPTKEAATENDVTFTVVDSTVVTVSGLTVLPLKEGSTSITIAWADKATTSVDVLVTDITVNEPEGPTSWADVITGNNGTEDYYDLLTALLGATIDDVLPFYYETEGNPSWYVTDTMFKLEYYPAPSGLSDVWFALLAADGWEQTGHTNNGWEDATTYAKNGYTVKITLDAISCWDLYLYPPEDTGEEGGEDLETAQAILNAAAAQTNGFQDFEYVNVQARYSNGGGGAYDHYNFDLTTDSSNNVYGREIRHSEDGDDETKFRTRYYYEKYYYDINNETASNSHSGPSSNSYNGVNRVLGWRLTSSRNYDAAFDNASSIDLAGATDFELVTEANGNYKLTFIYNNTWYCYKATADCELVGAGSAINWSDNYSYEIYYGEEESEDAFNAIMDVFFADEYWFPKQASDEEIAQEILNAAAAQTNGYQGFECVNVQARWSGGSGQYNHYNFDLTTDDSSNVYGREIRHSEDGDDETKFRTRYYYNKYYYDINNETASNSHSAAASNTYNGINRVLTWRLGSHDYDVAFDNASSIVLESATDLELVTESNGNYKLTFVYNNTWYCYKADTNLNLVGAGHAINWNDNNSYEIYYGEEESEDTLNALMEAFFADEFWFPKEEEEASDEEIAASILESAEDTTITWSAFHGEYIDESTDETDTLYLTTDSDGLYGSGICLDDDDPSFEYYYKNGKEYVHNSNNDSYYDGDFYYGDTYAEILSDFTSDALDNADWPDLDDDDWTLSTLTDGYELVVDTYLITTGYKTIQAQLVYITDTNFNITGLGYATFDSTFGNIEGWYAEQATTAQVEASLAGFDPANWGEVEEETEPSANEQVLAALEAFTERGADYAWGEGFSYTSMSIDSYSYVVNEIAATSDDKGYLTSSTIDFSISSYDSYGYYSDGLTTYVYDGENVTDYGSLAYGYSTFYLTAYMTFAWQDYDYILEALEEFVYIDDLIVDDDFVVSDTAIYIYAYTSDYGSYFELDATYDENGLTSLSFSSSINGEALAISLEPTSTISAPSWYL